MSRKTKKNHLDLTGCGISDRIGLWRVCLRVCAILLTCLTTGVTAGPSMPSLAVLEETNSIENSSETPHTKFARPYARGTVRTLFIVPQSAEVNVLPLRHVVELKQRFDIDGDAVLVLPAQGNTYATAYAGSSGVYGGAIGEERLARLLQKPYDCYVFTGSAIGFLPDALYAAILDHVRAGAGMALLYKIGDDDKPIVSKAEEIKFPAALAGLDAKAWKYGKGRLAALAPIHNWHVYHRRPPAVYEVAHIFGTDLPRDLRFERLGRAVLWAAGRQPRLQMSVALPGPVLDRVGLPAHKISITWKGEGVAGPINLAARIRSQSRGGVQLPAVPDIDPANGAHEFPLPALPAGRYAVDVIARGDRGVEGWAVEQFTVTTAERIGRVKADRDWGETGEPITGTVTIDTDAGAERTLRVHAVDRYGRIVARQEIRRPAAQTAFSLATSAVTPHYLGIEAALVADGEEICYGYAPDPYTIANRKQDQWNFILWGRLYSSVYDDLAEDLLAASGVTSRLETSHGPWWYMTRAGMNYTPYCASDLYRLPDTGAQEPGVDRNGVLEGKMCWNDEPAISGQVKSHLDAEMDFRCRGVLAYSMGDEQAVFGSCLHAACWKLYQDWLKNDYGTIAALNESWGAGFEKFDEIQPKIDGTDLHWLSAEDRESYHLSYANNEHGSKGKTHGSTAWTEAMKNYPRYIDRRSFQYWNFANYARRFGDTARRMDPHARVGVEGNDIRLDADIDVIVRNTGWWMPYGEHGGTTNEVIRSIAPRGYLHGNFMGTSFFWESFLRGGNTIGHFRIDSMLTPQMSLKGTVRRIVDSARIVFDGLGTVLNVHEDSEMLHDGIVMLHSMASVKLAKIQTSHKDKEAGPTYGNFRTRDHAGRNRSDLERTWRNHTAWHRAIRASGLQFVYTTDGQIRRGEFDPAPYKVMILSQYEAIGPEEEKTIRDFVANGGTVIADVRPGIYGARGKQRDDGAVLDDLFGVRHTGSLPAARAGGRITGTIADSAVDVNLADLAVNPALEVTTGTALGKAGATPICIVNEVGEGRAILLNFTMWSFPPLATHDGPEDASTFLQTIFAEAGVQWPLTMVDEAGRRHRNMESMRWRTGDGIEVVALFGPDRSTWHDSSAPPPPAPFTDLATPVPVTVRLPRPRHVCELRTGRRAGPAEAFATGVRPRWPTFLVLSERELGAPLLEATDDTVRRGGVYEIEVKIADAQGTHPLKLRAASPDGDEAPWFSQSVFVEAGRAQIKLPIAHNEQPGRWTVTVTDLYTGASAASSFTVK